MEIKILENLLQVTIDRGNLRNRQDQIIHRRIMVDIHDGSGQLDGANYEEEADSEIFVMGSDAAEFVNKVKDQVRNRQKRMSNLADSREEHSIIW